MSNDQSSEFVYRPAKSGSQVSAIIKSQVAGKKSFAPKLIESLEILEPAKEEQEAFDALMYAKEQADGGCSLAEPLRARVGCIVALLGGLACGKPWEECSKRSGVSYIAAGVLAAWDKPGFGALMKAAEAARDRLLVEKMRQALHKRAVEGVDNYKIGRIGKDQDGILKDADGNPIVERKYSDKLLEFGLSKLAKEQFGESPSSVNVGQQVVYNIHALNVGQQQAQKPVIDVEEVKDGDNPAIIDMDSIGELEE